jgi:hypothetical protein
MGGKFSRKSKEERALLRDKQQLVLNEKKLMLLNMKQQVESSLVPYQHNYIQTSYTNLIDIGIAQLDRSSKNLIKADLIAILIVLEPQSAHNLIELQQMTIPDLNMKIRSLIYDPMFIMQRYKESLKDLHEKKQNELNYIQ